MNYKFFLFLTILFSVNNITCGGNVTVVNCTGKDIYVFGEKHIGAMRGIFVRGFNNVGIRKIVTGKSIEIESASGDDLAMVFVRFKDDDGSDPLYVGDRVLVEIGMGGGPGKNRFKIDNE